MLHFTSKVNRHRTNPLIELVRSNFDFILGGLWHSSLIDRYLVSFFVPFLPLEREHVRLCVVKQLRVMLDEDDYEYPLSTNDFIDHVTDLIEFSSSTTFAYSLSGCKKVHQKLNYAFEHLRRTLPKTKKSREEFHDQL
jgi:hypothetical protein